MARIRKWHDQLELFMPTSLVLVSPMLYEKLRKSIEARFKKELRRMTASYLVEKYRDHAQTGACLVMAQQAMALARVKKAPDLLLTVFDVDHVHTHVRLRFPLSGEVGCINAFLAEIVRELGLERRMEVEAGELAVQVPLIEEDAPAIDTRIEQARSGRRWYCCAGELWAHQPVQGGANE